MSLIKSSSLNAATSIEAAGAAARTVFPARDYDLAATLTSGQAFRWQLCQGWWEGVIGSRWVCLRAEPDLQTGAGAGSEESPSFPLSTSHPSPACVDLAALASAEPPASAAPRRPAQQGSARRRPGLRPPSTRRAGRGQGEGCGRPSVIIAVSCPHRAEAFDACRWLIDRLKSEVAIWKKEVWSDGSGTWIHR